MALSDGEAGRTAAQALEKVGLPEDGVSRLAAALRDPALEARWRAADAVYWIGPAAKGAIPALVEALKDADVLVRQRAAKALGRMEAEARSAMPALEEALRDRKRAVRDAAREALGSIRAPVSAGEERP